MKHKHDPLDQKRVRIWFSADYIDGESRKEYDDVNPEHSAVSLDLAFIRISELRRLIAAAEQRGYDFVALSAVGQ